MFKHYPFRVHFFIHHSKGFNPIQGCWAVGFSRSEVAGSPKSCQEVHLSRGSCEVVEEVGFFPDGPMQRWNDDFTCVVLLLVERNMMCFFWFEIKGHRKKMQEVFQLKEVYLLFLFFLSVFFQRVGLIVEVM